MGVSWSKRFHRHNHHNDDDNHHPTPPPPPPASSISLNPSPSPPTPTPPPPFSFPPPQSPPRPTPTPTQTPTQPPPSYAFAANSPYPYPTHPQPPPSYPQPQHPSPYYTHNYNNYSNYARPIMTQPTYHPYFIPPPPLSNNPWTGFRPPQQFPLPGPPPLPLPAVPYVDHQSAKKIKNDVNVRKDSIRLEVDELNHDCHLVCFTLDAMVDGSITITYFAKEGSSISIFPEIKSVKIPFEKGIGQKFSQPSGSGIDLGFFDIDDLSKASSEDIFPLVISAESTSLSNPVIEQKQSVTALNAQITLAVLERKNNNNFQVKVIKQILLVDGARYELREIYGISNSNESTVSESEEDTGKECVICMTEPKDTTVLPCRHMCMCSECAKELRLQSNKCPICRQPIEELLEIKVDQE